MKPPRLHALIPSAGAGTRAGTIQPKQYQAVAGRAVIEHTLRAFTQVTRLDTVLVVVAPQDPWTPQTDTECCVSRCGGATRAASVLNGLGALRNGGAGADDWVLVHDAARCLITPALINRLIDACLPDAVGGLLAQPLADTLKRADASVDTAIHADSRVAATVARAGHWLAQTPQMFRLGVLQEALQHAGDAVTDEASAIEAMGLAPKLVPGSPQNFKVTWPEDFALAEALLNARAGARAGDRARDNT